MSLQLELLSENSEQWSNILNKTHDISKKQIKPFVILALKELDGNPDSRMAQLMNADMYSVVRAVVRHFTRLRSATKEQWKPDEVKLFLENLRFTPECIEELTILLCSDNIYENVPTHLRIKLGLVSLQWKIDLSLCQSNIESENATDIERKREIMHCDIRVIIIMELTDGQKNTYRLSIKKFQELRYTIASALKSMIILERRKCMKKD